MRIWKLTPAKPKTVGYLYMDSTSGAQQYMDFLNQKLFKTKKKIDEWQPTLLCNLHEVDIGRIYQANQEFWVFNEKARTALAPLLGDNVEYLPFLTKETLHERFTKRQRKLRKTTIDAILQIIHPEQQYLLNILDIKTSDIIDAQQSEYDYDEEDNIIYGVEKLAFHPEKIQNAHLFKIQNPGIYFKSATFISDQFKTLVEQNNLTGLKFSAAHGDEGGNLIWQSL